MQRLDIFLHSHKLVAHPCTTYLCYLDWEVAHSYMMESQPPTGWSTQKSKYEYNRDHLVLRLTNKSRALFSKLVIIISFFWSAVSRCWGRVSLAKAPFDQFPFLPTPNPQFCSQLTKRNSRLFIDFTGMTAYFFASAWLHLIKNIKTNLRCGKYIFEWYP